MRQIPNLLTILRILLTPVLYVTIAGHQFREGLWLCALAGGSDALDGFLARRFRWQTHLGAYLDPIADKAMLSTLFLGLASAGTVPFWFVWLIFLRDLLILLGTLFLMTVAKLRRFPPSRWGKLSTALQIATALFLLAMEAGVVPVPAPRTKVVNTLIALVLVVTLGSLLHYYWTGLGRWRSGSGDSLD